MTAPDILPHHEAEAEWLADVRWHAAIDRADEAADWARDNDGGVEW